MIKKFKTQNRIRVKGFKLLKRKMTCLKLFKIKITSAKEFKTSTWVPSILMLTLVCERKVVSVWNFQKYNNRFEMILLSVKFLSKPYHPENWSQDSYIFVQIVLFAEIVSNSFYNTVFK